MEIRRKDNFTNRLADYREESLVEDGAETTIKCSSCGEELATVWVVRPGAPIKTTITANCPHCGDKSFAVEVKGQYCLGSVENDRTTIIDTPTKTKMADGFLTQEVIIKTEKGTACD